MARSLLSPLSLWQTLCLCLSLCVSLCTLPPTASARPVGGARTLVLLDNPATDELRYSRFLAGLADRGHSLTLHAAAQAPSRPLIVFEELAYDHVVVLAPRIPSFGGALKIAGLIDFVNAGGNVLVAASPELSETLRDFAYEFLVDFDEPRTAVFDAFSTLNAPAVLAGPGREHTSRHVLSDAVRSGPAVVFAGIAHKVSPKNPLAFPVLAAADSAYAYDVADRQPLTGGPLVGSAISLASAFQARNNARVVFVGSTALFSDEAKAGNEAFAADLSAWAFQERSVLKLAHVAHHRVGESRQHGIYRIKDALQYSARILEWSGSAWVPFAAPDVQFEAAMLDPYIRTTMAPSPKTGLFTTTFVLPDQYGVFTFRLDYKRHGLSYLHAAETVQVRPYRHDQYPRFLVVAYPYYANIFSMMAAFFVFSLLFLYNKDAGGASSKTKIKTL
ncbi:Dolichyl-diphosphooligosaccharide--protein glycosyltransferase subunit WBP1 [Entophlyctis helioformis]|nr:Dolichyl-diphosphooligosaccharide--protein glycosyltransferase subunit WBP1 [Entophlyctis helioformis]